MEAQLKEKKIDEPIVNGDSSESYDIQKESKEDRQAKLIKQLQFQLQHEKKMHTDLEQFFENKISNHMAEM